MRHQVTSGRPGFLNVSARELLVLALLLLWVHPLHGQSSGSIGGTTIDAQTGMPIVGASITIPVLSRAVISDEGGHFLHSTLESGSHLVAVHAASVVTFAQSIERHTR